MPIDVRLAELPDGQRRAAEAVLTHVRRIKGLAIEAVMVGIFIKRERSIVELRPKKKWLDLSFISTQVITSERIARVVKWGAHTAYFVHLTDKQDVDAELRRWLTAALR